MKVWNVGEKDVEQRYNKQVMFIKANSIVEIPDDAAVFLLGKIEVRGQGLVQVKEGDKKEDRYREGRLNIYNWAKVIYENYRKHCEEREAQKRYSLDPHEPVIKAKKIIDEYEEWEKQGRPTAEEMKELIGEKKIYACPYCLMETDSKTVYFSHLKTHREGGTDVNTGTVSNQSKGEGR